MAAPKKKSPAKAVKAKAAAAAKKPVVAKKAAAPAKAKAPAASAKASPVKVAEHKAGKAGKAMECCAPGSKAPCYVTGFMKYAEKNPAITLVGVIAIVLALLLIFG